MDFLFGCAVVFLISTIVALVVLTYFKGSKAYLCVRSSIPLIILIAIAAYGYVSISDLYEYTSRPDAKLMYIINHPDTYITIATFVTLLGFYQLLLDRVEQYKEFEKLKEEEASVPLSNFQVITYAEHLRLVEKAEKKLRKKLKEK